MIFDYFHKKMEDLKEVFFHLRNNSIEERETKK